MKARKIGDQDFITLEGMDYNLLRSAEARAREDFSRPENAASRLKHLKTLFPLAGELTLKLVQSERPVSREIL